MWHPGTPITLLTDRYVIRSMAPSDVTETYLTWFRDPETLKFVGPELANLTPDQHRAIVASTDNRERMLLLVETRAERLPIGLFRIQLEPRHKRALLTVIIGDPAHRRTGVRVETHLAVRLFLYGEADVQKLTFSVYGAHEQLLRQLAKDPNVIREGVLAKHDFVPGLGWQDVHVFAMFRDGAKPSSSG